jgi:kynureninase
MPTLHANLGAFDPLASIRERFLLPADSTGQPLAYLCSHSLGLQARGTQAAVQRELQRWAELGVDGHFAGDPPWYTLQEPLRPLLARLLGARVDEVVFMNGLTINMHLLMQSLYRPTAERFAILTEYPPFPSDLYALQSQLRLHQLDPAQTLLWVRPRPGEGLLRADDVEALLDERGEQIALLWLNPVNYLTGQLLDVPRIASAARRYGCLVGLDLAHAAGNVPLDLHEWDIDFAVGCTYKYLCGGPGAVGFAFVHERHGLRLDLPRLAGWWGNDPAKRFRMHLEDAFVPARGAAGWQVSNPPILALAPLLASLPFFDQAGMPALRARSIQLTGHLEKLLDEQLGGVVEIITPRDPEQRGCQLSLRLKCPGSDCVATLRRHGIVADFRPPDVLRLSPVPLYNTFEDVERAARGLFTIFTNMSR